MTADVKHYARVLWRWSWLLIASTVLAAGISYMASSRIPKTYSATTTLMVGQALQNANPNAGDFQTSQALAQSYAQIVRREQVLQATVDGLQLSVPWQALAGQVNATALPNTQLLQITVIDNDPQRAMVIADEVARQLIRQSPTPQEKEGEQRRQFMTQQLQGLQSRITDAEAQVTNLESRVAIQTSARDIQDLQNQINALQQQIASWQNTYAGLLRNQQGSTNNLSVADPAASSGRPISPNVPLNVAAAAGIGFALALLAILLLEYTDDTLRTKSDIERLLKTPFFAAISRTRGHSAGHPLLATHNVRSPVAESYRVLRTQLQFQGFSDPGGVLLVTSAVPGEGKTTTACNLAVTFAQSGRRVIVCDTDFRRPSVHDLFGVKNDVGLSTLLRDPRLPLDYALQDGLLPDLQILPSGPMPPSPADLLGSPRMRERILEMEDAADVVILDTPALLPVVDASILAGVSSGALLVVESGRTRVEMVRRVEPMLEKAGLRVLGVVLNKSRDRLPNSYYAYYSDSAPEAAQPLHALRLALRRVSPW